MKKGTFVFTLLGFLLLISVLLVRPPSPAAQSSVLNEGHENSMRFMFERQAQDMIDNMTLRQKIAQLISIRAYGDYYANDHDRYLQLSRLVEEYEIGGIIFFRGDIYNQAVLTNRLQEKSPIPIWISQDMEFGAAMRIDNTTRITPAMGVAATGNPQWAFEKGRITAQEARAIGVHQVYAPVVDVNNNPSNPVINVRSFSEDPETVSEFGAAFIRGVQSQGIVATAKHFPGHGDTDTDSHLALPVIRHNYDRLKAVELKPFSRAIETGVQSIMTAHIAFPSISPNPTVPATLDPFITTGILRDSLGFNGLVVTDALEMRGISDHYSPGDAAIAALKAGADILLLPLDEISTIDHVVRAVREGEISEERIDYSVRKLLTLKIDHGLMHRRTVDVSRIPNHINTHRNQAVADQIARESLVLLRNNRDILPVKPERFGNIAVIAVSNHSSGNTGNSLISRMRRYHSNLNFFNFDSRTADSEVNDMVTAANNADLVVVASFVHLSTGRRLSFNQRQTRFIERIQNTGKPVVFTSFSSPYIVSEFPQADAQILAWSGGGAQPEAVADAIFGASAINGKLPITIPGRHLRGDGISIPQSILRPDIPETAGVSNRGLVEVDRIMHTAIGDSVFPGGVVAVVKDGALIYNKGFGFHDYEKIRQVNTNTIYDLASITKPVATAASIMVLKDEGKVSLDTPVSRYFDTYAQGSKAGVTIRHLLEHTSGLPPYRTYVDRHTDKASILNAVVNEPLTQEPGESVIYSDLGYILLAEIVEKITGESINRFAARKVFRPTQMSDTSFNPSARGRWVVNRIPPTEIDTLYRKTTVQGSVHDERAHFMGGVAGHAGLFGTASDLARFSTMLMKEGTYAGNRIINPETVRAFTARKNPRDSRATGFDLRSLDGFTTAGSLSSRDTYGHLGFTGSSIWIDPERNLAVIILTNRTYPFRGTSREINRVRAEIMDAVIQAIRD